jgi:serine/threonine protein kinase
MDTPTGSGGVSPRSAEPDEASGLEGRVLKGQYLLEKQIGAGGMGLVFRARDLEEQRLGGQTQYVAIKVLRPDFRDNPDSVRALFEEVRKTRELRHPNIVAVYGCHQDGDHVFMTMEYLEGKSLDALLDEDFACGMPWKRAQPVIESIGSALEYAHEHGVVHCDLKPSNVFVTLAGMPKVLDFGIAGTVRGVRKGCFDTSSLGALTIEYASPEMLRAQQHEEDGSADSNYEPSIRDDIYSLGCVVYEMLSGRRLYDRRGADPTSDSRAAYPNIETLPNSRNRVISRAVAFDATQRYGRVTDFVSSLTAEGDTNLRRLIMLGGTVCIALAAILGIWFVSGDHDWVRRQGEQSSRTPASDRLGHEAVPAGATLSQPAVLTQVPPPAPVSQPRVPESAPQMPVADTSSYSHTGDQTAALSESERQRVCDELETSWETFECDARKICLRVRAAALGTKGHFLRNSGNDSLAEIFERAQADYTRLTDESCSQLAADWPETQRALQQR